MKETNVKLFPVLDRLCGRASPSTPASFRPDLWVLQAAVLEYEMEERTFYWLPRSDGGLCVRERDVFLRGSHGHRVWTGQQPEAGEAAYLTGIHPLASVMGIYPHISEAAAAMVESLMQGVLPNTSPLVCAGSLLLIGAAFAAASVVALKKQSY